MTKLLRIERFRWQGQAYETWLIQRAEGRYMAKTRLGIKDCIITDGDSEDEALQGHLGVLPVALLARGVWVEGSIEGTSTWRSTSI